MLVVIPTTERPVQLQRIIAEEPGIRSVICLDGSTEEVPISRAYHAFVKRPTGIIEADFGHSSYRIDVSASIDAGKSWHLPVYLAHCLFSQSGSVPELAPIDTEQVDLIWASGEINHDRVVLPVEGIKSKVEASRELIVDSLDRGARVLMLIAESNEGQLRQVLEKLHLSEHPSIRVHSVHKVSIDTLAPFLGNEDSSADSDLVEALEDKCEPDSTVSRGRTALLSRILLLFALLGASSAVLALYQTNPLMQLWRSGDLQGLNQALEGSALWKRKLFNALAGMERIRQGDLSVTLQKIAPPRELSCLSATEVQALEPYIVNLWSGAPISGPPHIETTEYGLMQLCEVVYTVHNNSDRPLYINFVLDTADENGEGTSAGQLLEPRAQLDVSYSVKFYDSQLSYKHVWQLVAAPYDLRQLPRSQTALLGGWFGGLFIEGEHIFRHSDGKVEESNHLHSIDDKNKVQGNTADSSRFN